VAAACDLAVADVAKFYDWFATTERVVTLYSQGINQSSSGTDKVNAIINCHLETGRIGKPGAGPFSLTGQPNAMGGREVGGLANQLAAHMEIANAEHRTLVRRFWNAPNLAPHPGLKAVEMFDAIARGEVKAIWILCTSPAASLPNVARVREALARCKLVVVSDCMRRTDTTAFAHVLLPAAAWGEKDGTVTNSERRISRQRAFLPPPGEATPDWWMICEVAKRMGLADAFTYDGPAAIFREHAALSGEGNVGTRAFDISGLVDADYDTMVPVQWPVTAAAPEGTPRLARFFTADRAAHFVPVVPRKPAHAPSAEYPLVLNTGRLRDHWHTMSRSGLSPRLSLTDAEPIVEIHPDDADAAELADGALARVESRWGATVARVRVSDRQRRGEIFAPIHWTDGFASGGRVGLAVNPARDPVSGQPELKHTPVRVRPYLAAWHGFALSLAEVTPDGAAYWARSIGSGYVRTEMAGEAPPADWDLWARRLLGASDRSGEWIAYRDGRAGQFRFAELRGSRLSACLFVAPKPEQLPARDWLAEMFTRATLSAQDRMGVLAGRVAA
jgi:assimilatory nitrate reductase catalytic subunit